MVIVVKDNTYGLSRDAHLLKTMLEPLGWSVSIADVKGRSWRQRILQRRKFDVVIHLETFHRVWSGAGKVQILIPNPEWFSPRLIRNLKQFDLILTKTHNATEIFSRHSAHVRFLGFTSQDRVDENISKEWDMFFHLAGGSFYKGTEDILALWEAHPEWPELILIQRAHLAPKHVPANVTLITEHLEDDTLREMQNSFGMHLCPSRYEGWGHHLVEAMSCGALILTTDAPPMNEFISNDRGILVPFNRTNDRKMADLYFVSRPALEAAILKMIEMPIAEKEMLGQQARREFAKIDASFPITITDIFT